ncbi:unnamed protein product, partial [Clonostachys byssicola]
MTATDLAGKRAICSNLHIALTGGWVAVLEAFVMVVGVLVAFGCLFFNSVELSREVVTVLLKQQTDVYIDEISATNSYLDWSPNRFGSEKEQAKRLDLVNKRLTFPILA